MRTQTKQLFGGALFAAGIVAAAAETAQANTLPLPFNPPTATNYAFAGYTSGGFIQAYNYVSAIGGPTGAVSYTMGSVYAYGNMTSRLLYGIVTGSSTAYGGISRVAAYMNSAVNTDLHLTWDNGGLGYGGVYVYQFGAGFVVNAYGSTSGDQLFTLVAGTQYFVLVNVFTDAGGSGPTWGMVEVVPAPGAIALLGIAGLVGKRRRRE